MKDVFEAVKIQHPGEAKPTIGASVYTRICLSWKFDHTTTRAITVKEIVDINAGQLTVPLSISNKKPYAAFAVLLSQFLYQLKQTGVDIVQGN